MNKITQLTPGQERRLGEVYSEWLAVGRSCDPISRPAAETILAEFYTRIGKPAPKVLWFSSPAMCVLAYGVLNKALWGQLRGQLRGQLGDQLRDQLGGQLRGQLGDQLGGQLWDQLEDQLEDQLGDQLGGQLWDQLEDQLEDQLGDQLRDQLWGQLRGQLRGQLGDQLRDQLGDQLRDQLEDQLGDQLGGQLWDQLEDQLEDQLGDQLWDQLWDQLGDQLRGQLCNSFAGQHWCAWEVFYAFCGEIGVRYTSSQAELLDLWIRQSKHLHWWFPYEGIVLASERHTELHVDSEGRLHSESSIAAGYSDGWGIYAWHGTRVPAEIIKHPELITPAAILAERNAEIRRVMMERYGIDRFVCDSDARVLDRGSDGELLSIDLPDDPDGKLVALKLRCPSTSAVYVIRVPPEQDDYLEAKAWTFGLKKSQYVFQKET